MIQQNGTIFGAQLLSGNVSRAHINTTYLERTESSPWVVNTALRFIIGFVNDAILGDLKVDLQNLTQGVFRFNDTMLTHNDGYIMFGFSAIIPNLT